MFKTFFFYIDSVVCVFVEREKSERSKKTCPVKHNFNTHQKSVTMRINSFVQCNLTIDSVTFVVNGRTIKLLAKLSIAIAIAYALKKCSHVMLTIDLSYHCSCSNISCNFSTAEMTQLSAYSVIHISFDPFLQFRNFFSPFVKLLSKEEERERERKHKSVVNRCESTTIEIDANFYKSSFFFVLLHSQFDEPYIKRIS